MVSVATDFLITVQDYFELGVILLRKKLFTQATRNLEKAKKTWNGEPDELAQVRPSSNCHLYHMIHECSSLVMCNCWREL
jgi:hypothetical protein